MTRRAILALSLLAGLAAAPAPGSDDAETMRGHEAWITRQTAPSGQWCCDLSDGRPAEIRRRGGHYEVLYSREHWAEGTDQWIAVPDEAVLPQPSPILLPIAWIMHGHVFCIALPAAS